MAKQIIILEKIQGNRPSFRYALWAAVPSARQSFYANASAVSAYKNATAAETTAIRNGAITERTDTCSFEPNVGIAAIESTLQETWNEFQSSITNATDFSKYGTFWDGSTWTAGGA